MKIKGTVPISEKGTVPFIFAALLALAACGSPYPKLEKLDANAVVLAFGDSLTFGTGASPSESYPAALESLIERKVVRSGVPGETSEEGLARLPGVLDEVQPKLLLLCHGGNDFLRKLDDAKTAENVRAMVKLARERGIAVMILATPKPAGIGTTMLPFYADIGRENAIPVEGAVLNDVLTDRSLKADLVHPNGKGYRKIAEAIAKVLRKAGAV
ncbi:GDSL-type esterase/lipase family protein [Usitatibacter palustris]|uniref:Thioesterase 1/protease 1/lysophospholipase L1 n=1 Tax=Usitatibacter palustris TaxID=2732487 RepID=A0A6M4H9C4_9PROT|nr:GDSL-type esterase/lipase family protein [Usitatibacter palustris]QJR15862.1 Thioesterase 1/protease 1/lysophospholipase L1 [Usitatibacter palustris]